MIHSRYLHKQRYLCRYGNRSFERGGFHKRGSFFYERGGFSFRLYFFESSPT